MKIILLLTTFFLGSVFAQSIARHQMAASGQAECNAFYNRQWGPQVSECHSTYNRSIREVDEGLTDIAMDLARVSAQERARDYCASVGQEYVSHGFISSSSHRTTSCSYQGEGRNRVRKCFSNRRFTVRCRASVCNSEGNFSLAQEAVAIAQRVNHEAFYEMVEEEFAFLASPNEEMWDMFEIMMQKLEANDGSGRTFLSLLIMAEIMDHYFHIGPTYNRRLRRMWNRYFNHLDPRPTEARREAFRDWVIDELADALEESLYEPEFDRDEANQVIEEMHEANACEFFTFSDRRILRHVSSSFGNNHRMHYHHRLLDEDTRRFNGTWHHMMNRIFDACGENFLISKTDIISPTI